MAAPLNDDRILAVRVGAGQKERQAAATDEAPRLHVVA
jgi:hypothetical protein